MITLSASSCGCLSAISSSVFVSCSSVTMMSQVNGAQLAKVATENLIVVGKGQFIVS